MIYHTKNERGQFMTAKCRRYLTRSAAVLLAAALPVGIYFGACVLSDRRFAAAVDPADDTEPEVREGLWNYNALTGREQRLYRVLYDAMEARKEETDRISTVPTAKEFSAAFDAVLCDYPMFCDLLREECTLTAGEYSAYVTLSYASDGEARRQRLADTAARLTDGLADDDASAALVLHDTLTACTWSADDGDVGSTAYDALCLGRADAMGYALAYALVCERAGVDCTVVTGTVESAETVGSHAWNALTLNGVTGYTDVMWNDAAASIAMDGARQTALPFHGYYFLSYEEMSADHTPTNADAFRFEGDTQNYYEQLGCYVSCEADLEPMLTSLLSDAQHRQNGCIEFRLDPGLALTDYALEEALTASISAVNQAAVGGRLLRQTNRVYHTSHDGGSITVQLFYEDNNE